MDKENLKKLLLSLKEEDYTSNVDLHIHSNNSDGKMPVEKIIKQAKEKGKKHIAIADHNSVEAYLSKDLFQQKNNVWQPPSQPLPLKGGGQGGGNKDNLALISEVINEDFLIPAVEFDCFYKGVLIHILGYSMDIHNENLKKLYAKSKLGRTNNLYRIFKLRKAKDVINKIKQANGLSVLAHPACYWCFNLDNFVKSLVDLGLDGIETYYPYNGFRGILKFHSKNTVKKIADKYKLLKTGGTDSHGINLVSNLP